MDVLAAQVWHFWIAPFIVFATIALLVATVIGYFVKVVRPRYPRD